ncbi:hypothetical protein YC2023_016544 [Brassica napus]
MGYVYRFFLPTRYSNTRVMKSVGNLNDLTSPPPRGILYQTRLFTKCVSCFAGEASGGIDRLESAKDFMVSNDYVKDMVAHRRPSHPDEFAGYEILLEKLLARGPVVVVFDILPGYQDYDGKGIYTPDKTACQVAMFEIFKQHSVVVTGCGVGLVEGNLIEFWQTHDSQDPTWGVNGFGQLARRNGLIVAAVEFQV